MIVLDTNIVAAMMRPETTPAVLDWLATGNTRQFPDTGIDLIDPCGS